MQTAPQPAAAFDPQAVLHLELLGAGEIVDSLAEAAYITDVNRVIRFWNRTAETMTGWPRGEVVGRSCHDNILVHVDKDGNPLCGRERCPLHRAIVTDCACDRPMLLFAKCKDGRRLPVEVCVAPIHDAFGRVVGGIETFRDIAPEMEEMRRARLIQRHQLDSPLPGDPRIRFDIRYTPRDIVGGDYYRIERIGPDQYAVMIADVMGHGVAAALYTMQFRALWEDLAPTLPRPGTFFGELNRRLHALARGDEYFATAFYAVLHAGTGDLVCVNAGHPSPFLFDRHGAVRRLDAAGPGLGLIERSIYNEFAARMGKGDTFFAFTDGAVEITNQSGAELGDAGLMDILRCLGVGPHDVKLEAIEEALLKYSAAVRLPDDLTLLSARLL